MHEGKRRRDALAIYVQLSDDRSLRQLREVLVELWGDRAPGERTLEDWSRKLNWQQQIKDLEHQTGENQKEVLVKEHEDRLRRKRAMGKFAQQRGFELLRDLPPEKATLAGIVRLLELGLRTEAEATVNPIDVETELRDWARAAGMDPDEAWAHAQNIFDRQERRQEPR